VLRSPCLARPRPRNARDRTALALYLASPGPRAAPGQLTGHVRSRDPAKARSARAKIRFPARADGGQQQHPPFRTRDRPTRGAPRLAPPTQPALDRETRLRIPDLPRHAADVRRREPKRHASYPNRFVRLTNQPRWRTLRSLHAACRHALCFALWAGLRAASGPYPPLVQSAAAPSPSKSCSALRRETRGPDTKGPRAVHLTLRARAQTCVHCIPPQERRRRHVSSRSAGARDTHPPEAPKLTLLVLAQR
jgi:hypothetical protein